MRSRTSRIQSAPVGKHHTQTRRRLRHADRQYAAAMTGAAGRVADSTGNWVDTAAPAMVAALSPAGAARSADRLVAPADAVLVVGGSRRHRRRGDPYPDPWHCLLFFIGAFVMRGAGCTWNDITDRDLDAKVERTRSRPIPSGQVHGQTGAGVSHSAGADRPRGAAAIQRLHDPLRHPLARQPSRSIHS